MYAYRNLPRTAGTYYVQGQDTERNSAGILEWCRDARDARSRLTKMRQYNQFTDLSIGNWEND